MIMFDREGTFRTNKKVMSTKIVLKLAAGNTDPEQLEQEAWNFKRSFETKAHLPDGNLKIRGRVPRARVQVTPSVEEIIDATGKALGILLRLGIPKDDLKPQ